MADYQNVERPEIRRIPLSRGNRALIAGITGQDGAYLAKLLLEKGYHVIGAVRRSSSANLWRLEELDIAAEVELIDFDLMELGNVVRMVERTAAAEIYNLAGQSFVELSFEQPIYTGECNGMGAARLLEAVRSVNPDARYFQASSSEMFGEAQGGAQGEASQFHPRNPYGVAKLYAHWLTVNYREAHGLHASAAIMFNHESPLRGSEFVTRKITHSLAQIKYGVVDILELGNLDARRDWGFAADYVAGMWLMLQQAAPGDYVLATGEARSVREFILAAGAALGFDLVFQGSAANEVGVDRRSGRVVVRVNPRLYRPADVQLVCGDASKAREQLQWRATTSFAEMVAMMAEADARRVRDRHAYSRPDRAASAG